MLNLALLSLFFISVFGPMIVLSKKEQDLRWRTKYFLAFVPAAYSGLGWLLASYAYDIADCQGGLKDIHNCWLGSMDITPLIGFGHFLGIFFFFLPLPVSVLLLANIIAAQIRVWWNNKNVEQ